ncbi:hypothetical protein FHR83_001467 [Actinoplanes campanulatus]|uniref:Excreted virulence factor EspC, type VII ESX diderm n=1 Tax=Actinoplanes campanulatus TaxID=113559 RepID=A0A7W5FCW0_9ACTN|nr:hypothetical protein [Actinoplanes campanulatus]MBB3093818.1 hypothetical protein [Actinoplanes campanulatus]GGN05898.1 hypothetical protein GCM10010109_13400 [Actinoplanes campanulatus]GID35104.1 hypothetical protein Aca09nite_16100 [Actinoplanes campanulatus]
MGDIPGPGEVRAALEDLDSDSQFWFGAARIVGETARSAESFGLSGFEFGIVGVELGVLAKYEELRRFVATSLNDGYLEMEKLSLALRNARDQIDETDREAATGLGAVLGEAIGPILRNPPGR